MELNKICVSTTPEQMWKELQTEKKIRDTGFDLNNLPESNVSQHASQFFNLPQETSVYEEILARGVVLLEDELLRAMRHPRAETILTKHLSLCRKQGYGNGFYKRVQRNICLFVWGREFLYEYIKTQCHNYWYFASSLDSTAILLLQEQQNDFFTEEREKLKNTLLRHCANGWFLFEDTKLKLVGFPFAPEILMSYLKNYPQTSLSTAVLLKICKQSYRNKFLIDYAKFGYDIDYSVQEIISKLSCAKEFFSIYVATDADIDMNLYHSVCD